MIIKESVHVLHTRAHAHTHTVFHNYQKNINVVHKKQQQLQRKQRKTQYITDSKISTFTKITPRSISSLGQKLEVHGKPVRECLHQVTHVQR